MKGQRKQLQLDEAVRGVIFDHLCHLGDIDEFHNIAYCTYGCDWVNGHLT
jgi:hypothetical protein